MWFGVITIFPDMFTAIATEGIVARALQSQAASLRVFNLRDYADNSYKRVDERPFGGGPGMVMMPEPLAKAIQHARSCALQQGCKNTKVALMSPQGVVWRQSSIDTMSDIDGIILLCGRYEGIDQRIIDRYVDVELSVGDYVLSGGELPAMVIIDSWVRTLPGAMGTPASALEDSFASAFDGMLDHPHYTKPVEFEGVSVPSVLLSGHHANIAQWRSQQRTVVTQRKRPELLNKLQK